ncbi:SDR family oxidoreductase [Nocardia cyriacigeorgica]|uniref:3-oxoacyl-[acyl-carrier-protein] reductase MabA n=1 Tax=Nocardia cyriacigeorgica TaxID=135487 RepID=A0A6P1D534_9NOCA|nr:SDR family NAD(P)-dependent oxidoreductase [Nocardia cyriacigeorgica]NEW37701.1 SDR family oxidoreductase [Nocardia cyriacigeorgica]NEW43292.1 SDR family oxidoreductase [Nocardia cyriacigeorgica]NEW48913.1 SDR family oxidoreductase [Nocardia cyriacigeorgica]NEW55014.1 SDR family oxidoreductase [Nocardia cyriacigeorgica]
MTSIPVPSRTSETNLEFDFAGHSVIVTGAARGIGFEIGRFFHNAGATVYLVDFDRDALDEATAELGCRGAVADVGDTGSVQAVVDRVVEETGRVDVLVNNAGILRDGVLWKLSDADYEQVMAVHCGGAFRFTRACTPHFRAQKYGRVVNVTSFTGLRGNIGQSNYAMAKAGIIGFTKTAAKELAGFGVTVNAISPNAETRMIASIPDAKRAELIAQIPLGRFAAAQEMAAAVGFLASAQAGYITGTVLPVDGGISI